MFWFTAHLILRLDVQEVEPKPQVVREVIALVQADTLAAAWKHAEDLGRQYDNIEVEAPQGDAIAHYTGVRKVVACANGPGDDTAVSVLADGVQLTMVDHELAQADDVERLFQGEFVNAVFDW